MQNHDEKCRDMARSVLPSTARKRARAAKRTLHKRERSWARSYARAARWMDPERVDDTMVDATGRAARRQLVEERRDADKVGPLVRWARRLVAVDPALGAMDLASQLDWFEAILPRGLVGQHARYHLGMELGGRRWTLFVAGPGPTDRLVAVLEDILAAGALGELNHRLKVQVAVLRPRRLACEAGSAAEWYSYWPRLLHGAHDLDAFVAEVGCYGREAAVAHMLAGELRGGSARR